ncbi:MAG TPA: glycosyltransferase family 4 protein, partial [Longimicrobiales bacterium]|nr:glycosyltransferase family 4 protein [Longimicrobiales bacterium]
GGTHATSTRKRRIALRWAFRRSHAVVAVSRGAARHLESTLRPARPVVQVIHNGIRPVRGEGAGVRRELGVREGEILFLAVGNLYPVKGYAILMRALATMRRDHPELAWRLAIAGKATFDGPLDDEGRALREAAEKGGFSDRVHLLGHRSDVPDLLAASDVFVMPSLSEGLPIALLEAMFAGRAIVASAVGGIPEAIRPEVDGVLVPAGEPAALASSLVRAATDPSLRSKLGRSAGQRAVERFHVHTMTAAYLRLYQESLATARRRFPASSFARLIMR